MKKKKNCRYYLNCPHVIKNNTEALLAASKGKVIPLHAMEALGVREGIAPTHSLPWH
jgi:hypothetical protein